MVDVLTQIEEARERVGAAITHTIEAKNQIADLEAHIQVRYDTLRGNFNDTNDHLMNEAKRARDAASSVIDALLDTAKLVTNETQAKQSAVSDLNGDIVAASSHNVSGSGMLVGMLSDLTSRLAVTQTAIGEADANRSEDESAFKTINAALESAIAQWTGDLNSRSQSQKAECEQAVQNLENVEAKQFLTAMTQAVNKADTDFQTEQKQLTDLCEQEDTDLRNDRENASEELESTIENLQNALESLSELVSTTATTLNQGADEATDLIKLTAVGIETVIGLFENLQQIFEEIENSWSS